MQKDTERDREKARERQKESQRETERMREREERQGDRETDVHCTYMHINGGVYLQREHKLLVYYGLYGHGQETKKDRERSSE